MCRDNSADGRTGDKSPRLGAARRERAQVALREPVIVVAAHCATERPSVAPLLCLWQHGNVVNCLIHQDELLRPRRPASVNRARDTRPRRPRRDYIFCTRGRSTPQIFCNGAIGGV